MRAVWVTFLVIGLGALSAGAETKPLVIVNLGYDTCPRPWEPLLDPASVTLTHRMTSRAIQKFGAQAEILVSCFSRDERDLNADPHTPTYHTEFRWGVLGKPETERALSIRLYDRRLTESGLKTLLSPYFSDLTHLASDRPSLVLSSSWGGWVGLQSAVVAEATGLVTVDPIAPFACKPSALVTVGLFSLGQSTPVGCQQSPRYSDSDVKTAARTLRFWHHYYQTDFALLHSSALPVSVSAAFSAAALSETHLTFSACPAGCQQPLGYQHMMLSTYEGIWSDLGSPF